MKDLYYKTIEKFIKLSVKKLTKRLELPSIKVGVNRIYDNCSYDWNCNELVFGSNWLLKLKDNKDKNINVIIPPDKFFNRVYFVMAHEIAHYLQYTKFSKWFEKYTKQKHNIEYRTNEEYADIKLEKNASRIAKILLVEYKKESRR